MAVITFTLLTLNLRDGYAQTMDDQASAAANCDLDERSAVTAAAALDDLS